MLQEVIPGGLHSGGHRRNVAIDSRMDHRPQATTFGVRGKARQRADYFAAILIQSSSISVSPFCVLGVPSCLAHHDLTLITSYLLARCLYMSPGPLPLHVSWPVDMAPGFSFRPSVYRTTLPYSLLSKHSSRVLPWQVNNSQGSTVEVGRAVWESQLSTW